MPSTEAETALMTSKDVGRRLRCSQSTVEKLTYAYDRGDTEHGLRSVRVGVPDSKHPLRRYHPQDVEDFIERRRAS